MLEHSQNYWNARNPGSAQVVHKFIQGRERGKCGQMLLSVWRISVGLWQTRWMFSFKCTTTYLTYFPWLSGLQLPERLKYFVPRAFLVYWFICILCWPLLKERFLFWASTSVHKTGFQSMLSSEPLPRYFSMSPGWFILFVGLLVLFGQVLHWALLKSSLSKASTRLSLLFDFSC